MIHPSYSELIHAINSNSEDSEENMILNSRYSLVLATSKRARQLIDGARPMVTGARDKKPLSIAIDELYKGKVKILAASPDEEKAPSQETLSQEASSQETPSLMEAESGSEE